MEPRIQYAKTKDGVSIAFWVMGQGPPYVWAPEPPWSHIQLESQRPFYRQWFDLYATKFSVVRFDPRGLGLSDRDVRDVSIESRILDLEAVAHKLGHESFALGAAHWGTPLTIAYAARYPERVSRLVLFNAMASGMDALRLPRMQTLRGLLYTDWELYTENVAALVMGLGKEEAREWADFARACVTPDTVRRYYDAMEVEDVTECLPQVSASTLVLHLTGLSTVTMDTARSVGGSIPNSQMVVLEGNYQESAQVAMTTIAQFLGQSEEEAAKPLAADDIHTILFTDVESSASLTQRLGDTKARDVLRTHERIVRDALRSHGGSEVKTMGDGFMASFSSATKALECAIAMQRSFEERNEADEEPIRVRVGLNAGEPIAEEEDLFGTAVIVAARIAAKADGAEILAANVVRELAAGKGFLFADRGDTALRGFEDPVRLFEVRWRQ